MIMTLNDEDIKEGVLKAELVACELNTMLFNTSIRTLISNGRLEFLYHPSVMNGELGKDYKDGTLNWIHNGALDQLKNMLDKDINTNIPIFKVGTLGSIWFDTVLTGGKGVDMRTKNVRIYPVNYNTTKWNLMIDNTFDEQW
jgi:hypothetical protein